MNTSVAIERGGRELQDRAEVFHSGTWTVVALADGAGGHAGGAEAAELLIRLVKRSTDSLGEPADCEALLEKADREIHAHTGGGETTGIVVVIDRTRIFGASVGDSAAWLFIEGKPLELTRSQQRKPFLGTGSAMPRAFTAPRAGRLLVASDGLWKYASLDRISAEALRDRPEAARFVELVRPASRTLPDDIAAVIVTLEDLHSD